MGSVSDYSSLGAYPGENLALATYDQKVVTPVVIDVLKPIGGHLTVRRQTGQRL